MIKIVFGRSFFIVMGFQFVIFFSVPAVSGSSLTIDQDGIETNTYSSIVISGNGIRPHYQSDSTIIDLAGNGAAVIRRGATPGNKNVMLPITIPRVLYGKPTYLTSFRIFYQTETALEAIEAVLLRGQTHACHSCYDTIVHIYPSYGTCYASSYPEGCTFQPVMDTTDLSQYTSLYLTVELQFGDADNWIRIASVRLTLMHESP